ncbi:MAG: magnesium transporter [Deltaproteobacteria bacterium]|nr:magnesium transporter [Deltaproteobacteria bacterium]
MKQASLNARTADVLRRLVRRRADPSVRKVLATARPPDIAAAISHLTGAEQRKLFSLIEDLEVAADVMTSLGEDAVLEVTRGMTDERLVALLDYMEPDDATDVVEVLPDELRARVVAHLRGDAEDEVADLLAWPSDSAGGIMSPVVFKQQESVTCGAAIEELQARHEELDSVFYLYVVDARERLVGVVSLRALLIHGPRTPLVSVMSQDIIAVRPNTDQEEVARIVARYDLLAVPVVDEESRLMGIVTVDDVIDVIREEAVEDMMLLAGVAEDIDLNGRSVFRLVRDRGWWLLATAFGGIIADRSIHLFQAGVPVEAIAGLIPVVMGMGGNVGIQSTTITVRAQATGALDMTGALNFVWREMKVAAMLGSIYGLILGGYGLMSGWPDLRIGASVGTSVFLAILIGGSLGAGLPVVLSRFGVDPAVATGPFVTTTVDNLGIIIFFNIVRLFLGV